MPHSGQHRWRGVESPLWAMSNWSSSLNASSDAVLQGTPNALPLAHLPKSNRTNDSSSAGRLHRRARNQTAPHQPEARKRHIVAPDRGNKLTDLRSGCLTLRVWESRRKNFAACSFSNSTRREESWPIRSNIQRKAAALKKPAGWSI